MTKVVDGDGLTPKEAQACVYRATGLSQSDAYRRAFNVKRIKPETVWNKASKLFSRSEVQARVGTLLKAARVEDIDSVGQAFDDLLRLLVKAEDEGNLTAAANLMRQRLQAHGILRDRVAFTLEEQTSDADLLKSLAGDDPSKLAALQTVLGAPEGFAETRH